MHLQASQPQEPLSVLGDAVHLVDGARNQDNAKVTILQNKLQILVNK